MCMYTSVSLHCLFFYRKSTNEIQSLVLPVKTFTFKTRHSTYTGLNNTFFIYISFVKRKFHSYNFFLRIITLLIKKPLNGMLTLSLQSSILIFFIIMCTDRFSFNFSFWFDYMTIMQSSMCQLFIHSIIQRHSKTIIFALELLMAENFLTL